MNGVVDLPPIPVSLVIAVLAVVLAGRFRRQMLSDRKKWTDTRVPIGPSLKESPSPFDRMWDGVGGCAFSIVGSVWLVLCIAVAIDFLLADGKHVLEFLAVLLGQ